ncbi:MAG: hypothetical protein WA859_01300, partial [Candidatus Sulfotelmatobacter sp.]
IHVPADLLDRYRPINCAVGVAILLGELVREPIGHVRHALFEMIVETLGLVSQGPDQVDVEVLVPRQKMPETLPADVKIFSRVSRPKIALAGP